MLKAANFAFIDALVLVLLLLQLLLIINPLERNRQSINE